MNFLEELKEEIKKRVMAPLQRVKKSSKHTVWAVFSLILQAVLFGCVLWYSLIRLESDIANAQFNVTVAGVKGSIDQAFIKNMVTGKGDAGQKANNGKAFDDTIQLVVLGTKLLGTVPLGLGTFACIIIIMAYTMESCRRCGLTLSSFVSFMSCVIYFILCVVGIGILVAKDNKKVHAILQEQIEYVESQLKIVQTILLK